MLLRIFIGFLMAAVGFSMVWKTEWYMSLLGEVEWALRYLGGGGTRLFYKLLGTVIIILGFMVVTNLWETFIGGIFRSIFG